ncbi:uncharacterized protein LOC118445539 [Vespa mandarinia]|uniref:uncharacterized protein LOC118445539 n=1 Tax=Vespa mandarinia TaxID=7446 RepID=UPI00161A7C2C|nr:uncharacterized protein LOC118445539 [Vespa mandarinia]
MKISLIILTSILISCNGLPYRDDTEEDSIVSPYSPINLEKLRKLMKTGNETLKIPVLDPFKLKQYVYQIKEDHIVEAHGFLRNLKINDLSTFNVIKADINLVGVQVNIHLSWDSIKFVTDYTLKGTLIELLSIYGFGDIKANVKGLDLNMTMSFSVKDDEIYVRSFDSAIKLKGLDFTITGLFYDKGISRIVSLIVSDMTPKLIDDYQSEITKKFNTYATNFLNNFLKGLNLMSLSFLSS